MKSKINKLQEAYLLSREYANKMKEPKSTKLMLIAQENLIQGLIDWQLEKQEHIIPSNMSGSKIMKFATTEVKNKITDIALKISF